MLKAGEELILTVDETNMIGAGVARHDGIVIFCEGAVGGDTALATVTEVKKNYALAATKALIIPSPTRESDPCPYSEKCGGCSLASVTYEHELSVKARGVSSSFRRCGTSCPPVSGVISGERTSYRNKAVFRFDKNKNTGFYSRGTNDFVKIDRCLICDENINIIMKKTRELLKGDRSIAAKDLTYLYIRYMKETDEGSVVIGYTGEGDLSGTAEKLMACCPSVKCVMRGREKNPESRKEKLSLISGEKQISAEFLTLKMKVSPASFFQVNHDVAEKLCEKVAELSDLREGELFVDLYCGTGIIALAIAKSHPESKVVGVEINPSAVDNAKENARKNSIGNAQFFCGDASDFASETTEKVKCIAVDPPRAGLSDKTASEILRLAPDKLIYVSCNPSTMARDVKKLLDLYEIKSITAADMFPRTLHVENLLLLEKK